MSKNNNKTNTSQQEQAPSKLDELLKTGTTTIEAASREEVYKLSADLVAEIPDGTPWERSCVMFDGVNSFTQKYNLIKE